MKSSSEIYYHNSLKYLETEKELFLEVYKKFYNEEFSELTMKEKSFESLYEFYYLIKETINLRDSYFSIDEIKKILLKGEIKGEFALSAFTNYICNICKKADLWHNSAIPLYCDKCREEMAKRIINSRIIDKLIKDKNNK